MDAPNAIEQMFSYFAVVHDPRRQHPTTHHSLEAMLIITILATICGAHNGVEIEQWGEARQAWLSQFLQLPHGIPSHDTFGRVFCRLNPARLHQAFVSWMSALAELGEEIIGGGLAGVSPALSADLPRPGHGSDALADPGCASKGDSRCVGDALAAAKELAQNVGRYYHPLSAP